MDTVIFICPHGAAKSVIAAAHFQRLAEQQGLPWRAVCGGTTPDDAIAPPVLAWLLAEGRPIPNRLAQPVTRADLVGAMRVIAMNCEIDDLASADVAVNHWEDVPPVSQDLPAACAALALHVDKLIHDLNANH